MASLSFLFSSLLSSPLPFSLSRRFLLDCTSSTARSLLMVNQPEKTPLSVAEMWRAWPDPTKPSGETETESEEALQARLDKLSLDVP